MAFIHKPAGPPVTAHELVAEVCMGMAKELFDNLKYNNEFYKHNGTKEDETYFIERIAPLCKKGARAILGDMLNKPDSEVSQAEKDRIHEALVLDNMLPKSGTSVVRKKDYGIK